MLPTPDDKINTVKDKKAGQNSKNAYLLFKF